MLPDIFGINLASYPQGYITALAVFVGLSVALRIFKYVIVYNLKKIFSKTKTKFDDVLIEMIEHIGWKFYVLVALYVALQFVDTNPFITSVVYYGILLFGIFYGIRSVQKFIDYSTDKVKRETEKVEPGADTSIINLLGSILKKAVWVVAILLLLTNLGYDITPLIAGVGVGGIAIAFALQNVLGDVFASFSIYLDKPFKKSDYIVVGDDSGIVEKIGVKSTRIRTLQGHELVISNKELTETRIHNYREMLKRRVSFQFGVLYETHGDKLRKINGLVAGIFEGIEGIQLLRIHFRNFGDFSLNFEVTYYVNTGDYDDYLNKQQEINFAMRDVFESEGIEFAYPTQKIFLEK